LPDLAEYALRRVEQRDIDVCPDVEDADLQGGVLISLLQEGSEVSFLARIERACKNPSALRLAVCDQRRELVPVPASGADREARGRKFFGDGGAEVIPGPDHRCRSVPVFHRELSLCSLLVSFRSVPAEPVRRSIMGISAFLSGVARVHEQWFEGSPVWPSCVV